MKGLCHNEILFVDSMLIKKVDTTVLLLEQWQGHTWRIQIQGIGSLRHYC
ncbi:uncharacterized protein LACBIDRAFT_296611 [Laccaria bicolor S238N-H82]|uniref:Predicted protein n=1 Tax=Laccaria bicolor (strain S238N-H82 / ATCC MYA-4686) TaxID=486041 RepID=B0D989_LACBS|nr:uncharacterized protein LACBIDRAFT_296611 [Laccaria bicolor S238N-H82]EDR09209.1 predicted protein [Laccaria bicolor S238N-H82]|eukprot:XP_001880522.1 predicted protein [Laccaria bicolor S238N-H82]